MSHGLTAQNSPIEPKNGKDSHQRGGTYDTCYQPAGEMDVLVTDEDGNEAPAPEGWYFQQFVPAPWSAQDYMGVDGWFGPYSSIVDMPEYVRDNLTNTVPYRPK